MVAEALAGLELGAWDEWMVSWLAGWDCATVATIVSWMWRVRRAAGRCHVQGSTDSVTARLIPQAASREPEAPVARTRLR